LQQVGSYLDRTGRDLYSHEGSLSPLTRKPFALKLICCSIFGIDFRYSSIIVFRNHPGKGLQQQQGRDVSTSQTIDATGRRRFARLP
jgi:hypothetical protein